MSNIYIVATESEVADQAVSIVKAIGDDCHAMDNVWFLRCDYAIEEVKDKIWKDLNNPHAKIIVASIKDSWVAMNSPDEDDCFHDD